MRENGISVVRTRKHKVTTDSDHKFNIAPNLLDRDFTADQPNKKWAGDISYVGTREGWLYLAVILDLHSRRVIGWAVSNRMKRDLAIRALGVLDRQILGGFKRLSQRFQIGGCDDNTQTGFRSKRPRKGELAR